MDLDQGGRQLAGLILDAASNGEHDQVAELIAPLDAEQLRSLVTVLAVQVDQSAPTSSATGPAAVCELAINAAAPMFGTTPEAIRSAKRSRPVSDARAVAMTAAREVGLSLPVIAEHFDKDHGSVIHAVRRTAERPRLADAAARLTAHVNDRYTAQLPRPEATVVPLHPPASTFEPDGPVEHAVVAAAEAFGTTPDLTECSALLGAGVDDWGGVSPLTPDHVNPERRWPSLERLRSVTASAGFELRARLTAHPSYVVAGEPWIDPRVSGHVAALADDDGLVRDGVRPVGLPWQGPDGGFRPGRRGRSHRPAHRDRRVRSDRRPARDFGTVYGDWESLAEQVDALPAPTGSPIADRLAALRAAERDPGSLSDEHALTLMTAEGELLEQVLRLADDLRRETVGDEVTYVVNRNINFTNVCYVGCRSCAFAQRRTDADAYSLSPDQVADRAAEAWDLGASEVCMQGGIDPELPASAYFDLAAAVARPPRIRRAPSCSFKLRRARKNIALSAGVRPDAEVPKYDKTAKARGADTATMALLNNAVSYDAIYLTRITPRAPAQVLNVVVRALACGTRRG